MSIVPRHQPWFADHRPGVVMYGPAAIDDMMPSTLGTGVALDAGSPSLILPAEPTVTIPVDEFKDLVGAIVALVQGTTTINEKIDVLKAQVARLEERAQEADKRDRVSSILRTGRVSPAVAPPPAGRSPIPDEAIRRWIMGEGKEDTVKVTMGVGDPGA